MPRALEEVDVLPRIGGNPVIVGYSKYWYTSLELQGRDISSPLDA